MKRRHIAFLLCVGTFAVQVSTVIAPAADFTCQVHGGSFVLDDSDFKAIADSTVNTKEKFAALPPDAKLRAAICDTRKLARLFKAGKVDYCDLAVHYKNYAVAFFDNSELVVVNKAFELPKKKCP
jgi:hypothetical protein